MIVTKYTTAELVAEARALIADGRRRILGITGPPGSGKGTLAAAVASELGDRVVVVPMDGFHLANTELRRLGRTQRKGAPDTFDADGYLVLLRRLAEQHRATVYAPEFHRDIEEPIAGSIPVSPTVPLVITEGNYLLTDNPQWTKVRDVLDEAWYLDLDERTRVQRLVARHHQYGKPMREARRWATGSDQRNADFVYPSRTRADKVVQVVPDRHDG